MRTINLLLLLILSSTMTATAQWNVGTQFGFNKQQFVPYNTRNQSNLTAELQSPTTFTASAYAVYETNQRVNVGFGLSARRNSVHNYLNGGRSLSGVNAIKIDHKSVFLSVHPMIDISIDNARYFHVMVHPNLSFYAGGSENGYRQYSTGERVTYTNSTENINKFVLGVSTQLQVRCPLTSRLRATLGLGYSINNTVSRYVPEERGNLFIQAGVALHLPKAAKKDEPSTTKDGENTQEN